MQEACLFDPDRGQFARFDPSPPRRRTRPGSRGGEAVRPAFQTGLEHQVAHEVVRVGDLARRSAGTARAGANSEDQPVAVGLERPDELRFARRRDRARMERIERPISRPSSSASLRCGKRGSANPARTAFAIASADQRASRRREPTQPRSLPPWVRVTKVARWDASDGDRRPSNPRAGMRPTVSPLRRDPPCNSRAGASGRRRSIGPRPRIRRRRRRSRRRAPCRRHVGRGREMEAADPQIPLRRDLERPHDREIAASPAAFQRGRVEGLDAPPCVQIDFLGRLAVEEMPTDLRTPR